MNLTAEQAALITDLESYKAVTGAKRFKRTKEHMDLGLTPQEALQRELEIARGETPAAPKVAAKPRAMGNTKGDITLRLRPQAGTDADYFEHVPSVPVEIILDEKWYMWFDTLVLSPFQGDVVKTLQCILDKGIGTVLTQFHVVADVEEYDKR